jgi:LysM repeat protein
MEKNIFNNISPSKENCDTEKTEKQITRRKFIEGLAASAALFMVGKSIFDEKTTTIETISDNIQKQNITTTSEIFLEKDIQTIEQLHINKSDTNIIGKTFAQQLENNKQIKLDKNTRQAIFNFHYIEYSPGGSNYENGLILGLERMQPWLPEIKTIFKEHNVPEELIYLSIAESHFDTSAVSDSKAVGPYQITQHTANLQKLKMDMLMTPNYDERRDPIKSATLCAKHLKYSWKKFGQDWSFALMDYNGGFTNEYIEYIKTKELTDEITIRFTHILEKNETLSDLAQQYNTSITLLKRANSLSDKDVRKMQIGTEINIPQERILSMIDFNSWLEDKINKKITTEYARKTHTVQSGDTLSKLALQYHTTEAQLQLLNNLNSNLIKVDQKLKVPIDNEIHKKQIAQTLSGFKENINYPAKFYAILESIKKNNLKNQFANINTSFETKILPKIKPVHFSYLVKRGDTLGKIAIQLKKQYPTYQRSVSDIINFLVKTNNLKNKHAIQKGQQLYLEFQIQSPPSLSDIAITNNIDINKLIVMNPAVKNVNIPLPSNASIHLPKK